MWFVLFFILLYALLHVYFFTKVLIAFHPRLAGNMVIGLFLALMTMAPMLEHIFESTDLPATSLAFGLISMIWMAILFWACTLLLAFDGWNLVLRVAGWAWPRAGRALLAPRTAFHLATVLVGIALMWGVYEAQAIRVREVVIRTPKLPAGKPPIRVLFIADSHLSLIRSWSVTEAVVRTVDRLAPDLILSGGDLVDTAFANIRPAASLWRELAAPLGKYAVLGNHEYYAGLSESLPFHQAAGFEVLRATNRVVLPYLAVAGVDDHAGTYTRQPAYRDESAAVGGLSTNIFVIFLKHQPFVAQASFDVQLSGHTHGGQIFPFNFLVLLHYPRSSGLFHLKNGSSLYVTRGLGTWGPPLRLFAPPELTLIAIAPADNEPSNVSEDNRGRLRPRQPEKEEIP